MQPANAYDLEQVQLLAELIAQIDMWPAEVTAFEFQYEVFGCWRLVIRRNGARTRFDFDGKDNYLGAERLQPDAGDFTKPPKGLGGMALPFGLNQESLPTVLEFVRAKSANSTLQPTPTRAA
jgi:hypothetical protein